MEIKIQSGEQLNTLLEELAKQIVDANIYYQLFCDVVNSISDFQQEFNQSNTFWGLTLDALRDAYFIRLCRVYDQESNSLNLVNFLDTIKKNRCYFEEEHFRDRMRDNAFVTSLAQDCRVPPEKEIDIDIEFSSIRNPLVKKLVIWRNSVVAHSGAKISLGNKGILHENPISEDEIKTLLDRSMGIFNRYSNLYCASTWSTQMIGRDDYKNLLHFIRLGLQKHDENIQTELGFLKGQHPSEE